jgi:hypothetical protein
MNIKQQMGKEKGEDELPALGPAGDLEGEL